MGIFTIIIIVVIALLLLEMFKHKITKNLFHYVIIFIIFIVILLIASAYFDLSSFFSDDNTFVKTGATITEGVKDDVDDIDWEESSTLEKIEKNTKDFLGDILES